MKFQMRRGTVHILLGCFIYLTLLSAVRHLRPDGIFFYQGMALLFLTSLMQWLVVHYFRAADTPGKDALITFLLSYAFMFTVPTTVDRAYSVRLLVQLESHADGMSPVELEDWFSKEFAADGVKRRLHEQVATGSIEERDGRYQLTDRGYFLVGAFAIVQRIFATHSAGQ